MNRQELFKRTADILHPQEMRHKRVAVIGIGSGGARVAEEMARLGVGHITLIDRPGEVLEEHNIIRHPLGYRSLGRCKTEAMRDRLLDIFPEAEVQTLSIDVTENEAALSAAIRGLDLVHLCTDNDPSRHCVNSACVSAHIAMTFAGVFDGGCGGEVGRVSGDHACYACIAGHLNRVYRAEPKEPSIDYNQPARSQVNTTSALNIDIAQIALIQARLGMLMLNGEAEAAIPGNYILFGNRAVPGLFSRPLENEIWSIPPRADCLICRSNGVDLSTVEQQAGELLECAFTTKL